MIYHVVLAVDNNNISQDNDNNSRQALVPKNFNIPQDASHEAFDNSNDIILGKNEQNPIDLSATSDTQQDRTSTEFHAQDNSDVDDLESTLISFFSKKKTSNNDLECAIKSLLLNRKNNDQDNDDLDRLFPNKKQSHHEKLRSLSKNLMTTKPHINSQITIDRDDQVELNKSGKRCNEEHDNNLYRNQRRQRHRFSFESVKSAISESADYPSSVPTSNGVSLYVCI